MTIKEKYLKNAHLVTCDHEPMTYIAHDALNTLCIFAKNGPQN
jgi:hypothetical protein